MEETRSVQEITLSFNKSINSMLVKLEKRCVSDIDSANVDRLRKRITLLRQMADNGSAFITERAGRAMHWYSDQLLSRNESFFMDLNFIDGSLIKEEEFAINLLNSVKQMYRAAKQKERDELWTEVLSLYSDFIGYCMITGKNPDEI